MVATSKMDMVQSSQPGCFLIFCTKNLFTNITG